LADHRLFTSPDGKVGAALSPDGDIQNVYNNSEPKIKGAGTAVLVHAIQQGGRTLDCFDMTLPEIYRQAGFRETGRMRFNDEYARSGWDYAKYDRPDVVFIGWGGYPEGDSEGAIARAKGDRDKWIPNERTSQREEDWDSAKARSQALARGARVPGVAGAERGPEAYRAAEAPRPGASEGVRGDLGQEPQTPGSKVSFMPEVEGEPGKKSQES
jgi:hypothetical protein